MRAHQTNKHLFKTYRTQASSPVRHTFHEHLNWDSLLSTSFSNVGNHGVKEIPIVPPADTSSAHKRKAIPEDLPSKRRAIEILAPLHKNRITVDENQNYCVFYASVQPPFNPPPCSTCCKDYKSGCIRRNPRQEECLRCCQPTEPVANGVPSTNARKKPVPLPPTPPFTPSEDSNESESSGVSSTSSDGPVLQFGMSERSFRNPNDNVTQWEWQQPPCLSCLQRKNQLKNESMKQTQPECADFCQCTDPRKARRGKYTHPKIMGCYPSTAVMKCEKSKPVRPKSRCRLKRRKKDPCYPTCCCPPPCGSKPPCYQQADMKYSAATSKNYYQNEQNEQIDMYRIAPNELHTQFLNPYEETGSNEINTEQVLLGLQELLQDFTNFNQGLPEFRSSNKVKKQKSYRTMSSRGSRKRKASGCLDYFY